MPSQTTPQSHTGFLITVTMLVCIIHEYTASFLKSVAPRNAASQPMFPQLMQMVTFGRTCHMRAPIFVTRELGYDGQYDGRISMVKSHWMHIMAAWHGNAIHTTGPLCGESIRHINGFVQDCSNSIATAMELLQPCTKPSTSLSWFHVSAVIAWLICTIWTSMSDVPRKAVKFNHSLTHGLITWSNDLLQLHLLEMSLKSP